MKKIYPYLLGIFVFTVIFSSSVHARYDPDIKWRTVRNKNFTVYYPEGHEAFAGRVLSLTDEIFDDDVEYFGVSPRRLPVVLHPRTDSFNGFYSPFPHRISLFETPYDDLKWFGSTTGDIVDLVFTHEYTHYVHITTSRGLVGALSRVFGDGIRITNIISPGWALEGITTNLETKYTEGGRGRSHFFKGVMRSFHSRDGLWSLSAAGTPSPYKPPFSRIYFAGYYMIEYLNRVYGDDAFARISLYQAKHPLRGFGRALKKITEKSPRKFYREFLEDFNARCDSIMAVTSSRELPDGRTLISEPLDGFETHFWTDRDTIMALRHGFGKPTTLVEIHPVSGEVIKEIKTGKMNPHLPVRVLPDGRLFFGETFYHPLGEGELDVSDLVVLNPVTRNRDRLTHGEHIYSVDISPDGNTFTAVRRNGMWIELVLLARDGTNIRTLVSKPGCYFESPTWAPDGKTIAVTVKTGKNTDIAFVDAETGGIRTVFASDAHGDGDSSFSPDGRWLVFTSAREDTWNIYAWDMNNRRLFRLTSVFTCALEPRISPDGQTLSFLVYSGGEKEIRVMPFVPEKGHTVHVEAAGKPEEPDIGRLQPSPSLDPEGIPLCEAYKPFLRLPYPGMDRDGLTAGAFFMGGDPVGLNAYNASVFYESGTNRPGYNLFFMNRSFWPTLYFNMYDYDRKDDALPGNSDYWHRERGGKIALGQLVLHQTVPSVVSGYYEAGVRMRRFGVPESAKIDRAHNQSFSLYADVIFERRPDSARRDMVPGWGQGIQFIREEELSALGGEIKGHNMVFIGKQFMPSPIKHHGFEFTLAHQNQQGALHFVKGYSIPRGYYSDDKEGGLNLRKTMTVSLEYRFPVLFLDKGIGVNFIHAQLVRGSLFAEQGAGWSGDFSLREWGHDARTSYGATLTVQTFMFSFVPLEFGICAGYKPRENEEFMELILDVWGSGMAVKNQLRKKYNIVFDRFRKNE